MSQAITRIALREIRLTLKEPFQISSGTAHHRRILLLELADDAGHTAWSECVAGGRPNYSPETIDTAWLAIREWVAPRVLGHAFEHPAEVQSALRAGIRGHEMAKAAVEMGAWGLAAERRGISLSRLIGGSREEIATGISLGIQASPEALIGKVRAAVAAGYAKVKIKIQPGADVEVLAAVRAAVGGEVSLMADANSAYTLADAEHLARLDPLRLSMIEQPLAWDDLVQHAELQERLATPICLDESITSVARARDMLTLGSGRIVNLKPGRVGGFAESKAIHDLCLEHRVPLWCGGMLESGIGRAYNVALASLPGVTLPGDLSPSARYWERDVVRPEWTMDGRGMVRVPRDRPGLGVTVDVGRIDDLTVRREEIS